eukprot:2193772-Amphidinium_carterae.1
MLPCDRGWVAEEDTMTCSPSASYVGGCVTTDFTGWESTVVLAVDGELVIFGEATTSTCLRNGVQLVVPSGHASKPRKF